MIWCWWCCHPIKDADIGMPVSYHSVKDLFHTYGHFCSVGCVKAYNHNEPLPKKANQMNLISLFLHKHGLPENEDFAPPRQMLKVFGGTMTIEEFRSKHKHTYHVHVPESIHINHTIDVKEKSNYKWIRSNQDKNDKTYSMKDFEEHASSSKVENNAIKMKPAAATNAHKKKQLNTLEMVLGLLPNSE
jgi:hypothetical protein